jgi:glutaredoxin
MVKVYLSRKGVPFTEHNVSQETDARDTLLGMGYRATPVTVIGESLVVGYNTGKIDEALAAAGV